MTKQISYPRRILLVSLAATLLVPSGAFAQWNGIGITGGTGNNTIDLPSNWNTLINGAFTTAGNQTLVFGTDGGSLGTSAAPLTFSLNAAPAFQTFTVNGVAGGSTETIFLSGITVAVGSRQNLVFNSAVTVNLGNATRSFNLGNSASTLSFAGILTGTGGGFTIDGAAIGTVSLQNSANSFTGGITVNSGGELSFNSIGNFGENSALGTGGTSSQIHLIRNARFSFTAASASQTSNRTFILSASSLTTESNTQISNDNTITNRGLVLSGDITATPGTTANSTASYLRLTGGATAQTNTFSGVFSDGANVNGNVYGLKKEGANATWIVSNVANTYGGPTIVTAGVLEIAKLSDGGAASSIGDSSNAATNLRLGGGTLRYAGAGDSTDRLFDLTANSTLQSSGAGAVNFTNTGSYAASGTASPRTLTLGGNNTGDNTLAGAIINSGTAANVTSVTKADTGKWILSGNSTYSGGTTVNAGTLLVNNTTGSGTGTGAVTVLSGATFGGSGNVTGAVTSTGIIAPGGVANAVGTLSTGALTLNNGASFKFELGAGSSADLLAITGNFNRVSGTFNFDFAGSTNSTGGTWTLVTWTGTTNFASENEFSYTNLGNGLTDGVFTLDAVSKTLTFTAIPEPSTYALAIAGLIMLAVANRRRRRLQE